MTVQAYRPISRVEFIPGWVVEDLLLEIGPGVNPQFRGPLVEYFDLMSSGEMRSRYDAIGEDSSRVPERIHYVSRRGNFDVVPDTRFATVASCHNIEHHPCLVRHLRDVSRVLKPGGAYVLLIPDHRYCFDRCYPASTIADVVGAWTERRTTHEPRKVIRQRLSYMHNDFTRHWAGDHGEPFGLAQRERFHLWHVFHQARDAEVCQDAGGFSVCRRFIRVRLLVEFRTRRRRLEGKPRNQT